MKNKTILYAAIAGAFVLGAIFLFLGQKNALEEYTSVVEQGGLKSSDVSVTMPRPNDEISSPVEVSGTVKGTWFFEGSFPIRVYDESGAVIGTGLAGTKEDWMTEDAIPFFSQISFENPGSGAGWIRLSKDNPSGLPEHDASEDILVRFVPDPAHVKVFFQKYNLDSSMDACTEVHESIRIIEKTDGIARAAINELLGGVNGVEADRGFFSNIPEGVVLRDIKIEDGTAYADFNDKLNAGGSCRVSAIRAQIEETLKQFPTVSGVVISVNGNVDEALQP